MPETAHPASDRNVPACPMGGLFASSDGAEVLEARQPATYTDGERQFSQFVMDRLKRLLRGDDNELVLMRRYRDRGHQVAFFMPARIRKMHLRPRVAEGIVCGIMTFLDPFSPGGPIAQFERDGHLTETQEFPTQYPHIVVERRDVYDNRTNACMYTEWRAVRLQNQRKSTLINRALDVGNLAMEIAKFVRVP